MSSKPRRRVTVEAEERRKPSVFERLGPGAPPRSAGHEDERDTPCRHYVQYGVCKFGEACKFKHPGRARSPDDLRRRVPKRRDKDSLSDSDDGKNKELSPRKSRKDKESKIKSTVVVSKPVHESDGPESDAIPENIDDELDFDTTLKLIKKRQALQKQLSLLEYEEQENDHDSFTKSRSDDEPDRANLAPPAVPKQKKIVKSEEGSPPKKKIKDKKKKKKKSLPDSPEPEPEKKRLVEKPLPVTPPHVPPPPVKAKPKSVERKGKVSKSPSSRSSSRSESRSPVRQRSPAGKKKVKDKRKRSAEKLPTPAAYELPPAPHSKKLSPGIEKRPSTRKGHSPAPEPPKKESWQSPERRKVDKQAPRDSRPRRPSPPPPPPSPPLAYEDPKRSRKSLSPGRSRPKRPASPSSRSKSRSSRGKKPVTTKAPKRRSDSSESSSSSDSSDSSSSSDESVRKQTSAPRDKRSDRGGESYKHEPRESRDTGSRYRDSDSATRKRQRESDDRAPPSKRGRSRETARDADKGKGRRQVSSERSPVKRRAPSPPPPPPPHRSRHEQSPMEVSKSTSSPSRGHDSSRNRGAPRDRESERSDSRPRDDRRSERGDREHRREESPRTRTREEAPSPSRSGRERERPPREEYESERSRKVERSPEPPKRGASPSQEQLRPHHGDVRTVSPSDRHRRDYREEYYSRDPREARDVRDPRDPRDPREARDPRALDERHLDPRYLESLRYSEQQYRDREGRADPRLLAPDYRDPYADPRRERYDHALAPDPRYERDPRYDPRYDRRYQERLIADRRHGDVLRDYRYSDLARLAPEELHALERERRAYPPPPHRAEDVYADIGSERSRRQQLEEFERRRAMYDRKDPRYDERLERDPRDIRGARDPWVEREEEMSRDGRRERFREPEERDRGAKKDLPDFGIAESMCKRGGTAAKPDAKAAPGRLEPVKGKRPLPKDGTTDEGDRKRTRGDSRGDRSRDGKRRGDGVSDWSEEDREQSTSAEGGDRGRRPEESRHTDAPEGRERDRRSPSRSSLGSKVSHRDREGGDRYDDRRRGDRDREREKRDEEKPDDRERATREDDKTKKAEEKEENNSRSGSDRDKEKEDSKKRAGDHVSESGSARGARKDSVRSMDSFSSFDQAGGHGAAPPISIEPAPATVPADSASETTQDKSKEPETPTTASTIEAKPEIPEKSNNVTSVEGADTSGDLRDAYDDISDEEIDGIIDSTDEKVEPQEESKQTIVDVLAIDWASLATETSGSKQAQSSALKRFTAANIFANIGVSREYAGDKLTNEIIDHCQKQLDEEAAEDQGQNGAEAKPKFELYSDIACFHSCVRSRMEERAKLMKNIGPFRRALCARRDLYIRRRLCKLDGEHDLGDFTDQVVDQDIFKRSVQLLKAGTGTLDKKPLSTAGVA